MTERQVEGSQSQEEARSQNEERWRRAAELPPEVFAAGDVTHVSEQALVHIGEGAKAAISAYHYLLMH